MRAAAVAASAALYVAAFTRPGAWPLAWVALAPWLAVSASVRPRAAAGWGLAWSGLVGLGVAGFLPATIARYFEASPATGWAAWAAIVVLLYGVHAALFAAFVSACARRGRAHPTLLAAAFGALELARATLGIPNPWALIAATQVPWTAFAQAADLAGPIALGLVVVAANACAAGLLAPRLAPPRPVRAALGVALAVIAILAYGRVRLAHDFAAGPPLAASLLHEPDRGDGAPDEAALRSRLARAERAAAGADLVVWPELSVGVSLRRRSAAAERVLAAAGAGDADWLVGAPELAEQVMRVDLYNSVFLVRGGAVAGRYDKARLVPFAETDPFAGSPLGGWLTRGRPRVTPGAGPRAGVLHTRSARVGVLLCSEALYPGAARAAVARGAELLVNPSVDTWYGSPAASRQLLALARLRAIESRRPVLRATRGGRTALIDPHGRVAAELPSGGADALLAAVRPARGTTLYQRTGDAGTAGVIAACALAGALGARRAS